MVITLMELERLKMKEHFRTHEIHTDLLIAYTVTGLNDEVMNNNPDEFLLSQNYPNPFNPARRSVACCLSSSTLKVFNLLGNEFTTLVDEYKPAGNYEVDFNAAGLSSGMYFYKLQTGNLVETKKMILLR